MSHDEAAAGAVGEDERLAANRAEDDARAGEPDNRPKAPAPRLIAVVGPYGSGKTTLVEAMCARSRPGRRAEAARDEAAAEPRAHVMSTETQFRTFSFLGDDYTVADCPGSVEFAGELDGALAAADLAVVVCEADERKLPALQTMLKNLEERGIPRVLFLNKIDRIGSGIRETLEMLQRASRTPLVLRQMPIWQDGIATGFVDLALERAYVYREHAASRVVAIADSERAHQIEARFEMLERVADYDDALLEELLSDIEPPRDRVFDDLAREMADGLISPVFIGQAVRGNGVFRLMKALRHEAPPVSATRERLGLDPAARETVVQVLKTLDEPHAGRLSLARVLAGRVPEQITLYAADGRAVRSTGLYRVEAGRDATRRGAAGEGEIVALARLEGVPAGATLTGARGTHVDLIELPPLPPVLSLAVAPVEPKDEARLSEALRRLAEEDRGLTVTPEPLAGDIRLGGQGELHLKAVTDRLEGRYGLAILTRPPRIAYREALARAVTVHGRHKKQSGGHGQFGDVTIEFAPRPRGEGFAFAERIAGGTVPRAFIPAVEAGVRESLGEGPQGFPVVDLAATLTGGSFHPVDSSEAAFRAAAHLAVREALATAGTVLLEPVMRLVIDTPAEAGARVSALVSGRRGQIAALEPRHGWPGWDTITALMPEAEMQRLILDIRAVTQGVGRFQAQFSHLAALDSKQAAEIADRRRRDAA
ncbi:elongation factor G [Pseudoxanthobacter sp.]|uniref:elongation factor G n=1 Tax=Pseudoxanthobacter sp. TaxID=1925742 RepID=UPI002FE23E6E